MGRANGRISKIFRRRTTEEPAEQTIPLLARFPILPAEAEKAAKAAKGLPRPFVKSNRDDKKYPAPYSAWEGAQKGIMSVLDDNVLKVELADRFENCDTCGLPLGESKVFGLNDDYTDAKDTRSEEEWPELLCSGLAMHPKCAVLAMAYCPHFKKNDNCFAVLKEGRDFLESTIELQAFIKKEATGSRWDKAAQVPEKNSVGSTLEAELSNHRIKRKDWTVISKEELKDLNKSLTE